VHKDRCTYARGAHITHEIQKFLATPITGHTCVRTCCVGVFRARAQGRAAVFNVISKK